jgi:hypothetical protein
MMKGMQQMVQSMTGMMGATGGGDAAKIMATMMPMMMTMMNMCQQMMMAAAGGQAKASGASDSSSSAASWSAGPGWDSSEWGGGYAQQPVGTAWQPPLPKGEYQGRGGAARREQGGPGGNYSRY